MRVVLRIRFGPVGRRVSGGGGRVREEWCAVCVGVRTRGEGERWGERRDDRERGEGGESTEIGDAGDRGSVVSRKGRARGGEAMEIAAGVVEVR